MPFLLSLFLVLFCNTVSEAKVPSTKFQKLPNCSGNKTLVGFAFRTVYVRNGIQCTDLCARIEDCTSVNVGNDQELVVCELNKHFVKYNCSQLRERIGFDYYEKVRTLNFNQRQELGSVPQQKWGEMNCHFQLVTKSSVSSSCAIKCHWGNFSNIILILFRIISSCDTFYFSGWTKCTLSKNLQGAEGKWCFFAQWGLQH